MNDHEHWMRLAIDAARRGAAAGQTPFGAAVVQDGRLVVAAHNVVYADTDITAHAEVHALRLACKELGVIDLSDCAIYSTCEPCPMCFSAIHWARCSAIVFGARIADAEAAGFNELPISNEQLKALSGSPVLLVPDFLRQECARLFDEWKAAGRRPY